MSTFEYQAYICPWCFNDHSNAECKTVDVKERVQALEQKLAVAVEALWQYKDFEITRVIEGGGYNPKLGDFKMEKLSKHTWSPAKEALAFINPDAKKEPAP